MIHQHYEPQQILWFLRNYWKFTRDNMILEWHRTFQDQNFGKSQYQWLKSRYGMKAEWGAALNHPPYADARPGGAGTELYEPPEVPTHPPRMTFRTRSDSPTPNLVTAPASQVAETPRGRRSRRASSAGGRNHGCGPSYQNMTGSVIQTPLPTPPMHPGIVGAYNINSRAVPGAVSGTNGTYSISLPTGLGSPFMPTTGSIADASMNALMPLFSTANTVPTPNSAGPLSNSQFPTASGFSGIPQMSPQQPLPPSLASYQFAANPSFNQLGGEYFNTSSSQGFFPTDNTFGASSLSGLSISNANPYFQASGSAPGFAHLLPTSTPHVSPAEDLGASHNAPGHIAAAGSGNTGGSASNADIISSMIRVSAPIGRNMMETVVTPVEKLGPVDLAGKRKRVSVSVDCPQRKRPMLDPTVETPDNEAEVVAAQFPANVPAQGGGRATKGRRKKSASPRTRATTPAVSFASTSGTASPSEAEGEWHDGMHGDCSMGGRHRHDSSGGIYFAQPNDFAAAAVSHTNHMANTPQLPEAASIATTAEIFDLVTSEIGIVQGSGDVAPTQTQATEVSMAAPVSLDGTGDVAAHQSIDVEHLLVTQVSECVYGEAATSGVDNAADTAVTATASPAATDLAAYGSGVFDQVLADLDPAIAATTDADFGSVGGFCADCTPDLDLFGPDYGDVGLAGSGPTVDGFEGSAM